MTTQMFHKFLLLLLLQMDLFADLQNQIPDKNCTCRCAEKCSHPSCPEKFTGEPDWLKVSEKSRKIFDKICSQFQPGKGGAEAIETVLFSLAHGYVKLIEIEHITPRSNDSRDIKYEDIFSMINFVVKPN